MRGLELLVALSILLLLVPAATAQTLCPGEMPTPWAGPTLYSGGMHFAVLGGVSSSIALFRRLNGLPDIEWPKDIFYYPWSWPDERSTPSALDRLRWAAQSAMSGDASVFTAHRPREPASFYETYEPLPAIALDLATAPAAPLDWWLQAAADGQWTPNQKAVHQLARDIELIDWLQTAVTASHASWVFEWSFVPSSDLIYAEWRNVFRHAVARWKAGDGFEWAAVALELLPPRQVGVPAPRDDANNLWFDYAAGDELLALYEALIRKVKACTATTAEVAAALALAAPAHAHGASPTLLQTLLPRSREAVTSIAKKGLRRALIEARDVQPWFDVVKAVQSADPNNVPEDLVYIARLVQFLRARSLEEAVAVYDGRSLDAEAEDFLNLLPYKSLTALGTRKRWPIETRGLVVRAALARAWALGNPGAALRMLPLLADTNPELSHEVAQVQKTSGRVARERALLLLLLRTPGMNLELASATFGIDGIGFWGAGDPRTSLFALDHMRHSLLNWWCAMRQTTVTRQRAQYDVDTLLRLPTGSSYRYVRGYVDWEIGRHETSQFRSTNRFDLPLQLAARRTDLVRRHPVIKMVDDGELKALASIPSAPEALSRTALAWAKSVGQRPSRPTIDRDVPEALHRAVQTTRWGCPIASGHGAWSREAFTMLRSRYPASTWAKRTPNWFDTMYFGPPPPLRSFIPIAFFSSGELVAGLEQKEWIRRYWVWARSFPLTDGPSSDRTGSRCTVGQSGPVWFLTGSRDAAVVRRHCEVPAGKIVLVPIVNTLAQASRGVEENCDRLQAALRPFGSSAADLRFQLDGTVLERPTAFSLDTGCFKLRDASSGLNGMAAGTGYWLFLKPLPKGQHGLQFGGRLIDGFWQDVQYQLEVR